MLFRNNSAISGQGSAAQHVCHKRPCGILVLEKRHERLLIANGKSVKQAHGLVDEQAACIEFYSNLPSRSDEPA